MKNLIKESEGRYVIPSEGKIRFASSTPLIVFNLKQQSELDSMEKIFDFSYHQGLNKNQMEKWRDASEDTRRTSRQMFYDTFQGKTIELALYRYFVSCGVKISEVDLVNYKKNEAERETRGDQGDFIIGDMIQCSARSMAFYSNVCLLECSKKNQWLEYDLLLWGRMKPALKDKDVVPANISFDNKSQLKEFILSQKYEVDLVGGISHKYLSSIIEDPLKILTRNSYLQGTRMNTNNYYLLASDLKSIDNIASDVIDEEGEYV